VIGHHQQRSLGCDGGGFLGPLSSRRRDDASPQVTFHLFSAGRVKQEVFATALLAVMSAVKEYGRTLTKGLGAHAGEIESFIEVEFDLDGRKVIPDGLIRVTRGSRIWAAIVEVKTGRNELQTPLPP